MSVIIVLFSYKSLVKMRLGKLVLLDFIFSTLHVCQQGIHCEFTGAYFVHILY